MRTVLVVIGFVCVAVCVGQWSEPSVVLNDPGPTWYSDPKLVTGPGDTVWVLYVRDPGPDDTAEIRAQWNTGDTWSAPQTVVRNRLLHALGVGVDPQGRIWLAWYNGDYLIDPRPEDTWGIWTCMRESGRWTEPELAIKAPQPGVMNYPAGHSFGSDAEGNWYMGIQEETAPLPDLYQSAMYSRMQGDTWTRPRYIDHGRGEPEVENHYVPSLVPHPNAGFWSVHDHWTAYAPVSVKHYLFVNDTAEVWGVIPGCWGHEALRHTDFHSRLRFVHRSDWAVECAVYDTMSHHGHEEISEDVSLSQFETPHICSDTQNWIWVGWTSADTSPVVSYQQPYEWWSDPEPVTDSVGWMMHMAADQRGRVHAMFRTEEQRWYTTYRPAGSEVEEQPETEIQGPGMRQTVCRGALLLLPGKHEADLLDITGRKVMELQPGENDVGGVAPGVYFTHPKGPRGQGSEGSRIRKVIIQR